jgi:hypothetical protein
VIESRLPERLRAEIGPAPARVRPLARPWIRSLALLPLAVLLLVAVPRIWSLRWDAPRLGPWRLWAGSGVQILLGLAVIAAALQESIPGRLVAPRGLLARACLGLGFMVALTAATFISSPTRVPSRLEGPYFEMCATRSFALGLLALGAVGLLLRKGLVARPATAGGLGGLGAGLLADASWRLFCEVSDPVHVLTAHAGAILAVALTGALAARLLARRKSA